MAKSKRQLIAIECPCCQATLQIDPELKAVISHKEPERPPVIADLQSEVQKLKGAEAKRAELFEKSFSDHKSHQQVLERKFDELLKQAKDDPEAPRPRRPFDLD